MSSEEQKTSAKKELLKLVNNFREHIDSYKSSDYNEASLRIDYLNKFFELLGWDITNKQGLPPSYREVITEDSVQVEGRSKSPDYSFRLNGSQRMFFVEAKKPFVNITKHEDSSFQLRRYGWSADIPVSLLTSFEYIAVYDCTIKPKEGDKAAFARLKLLHFEEYIKNFDYIWDNFSKSNVICGSLNRFSISKKNKKGSASVDKDFLESLDDWRIKLAKDINEQNNIGADELNFAVQQIIDRIIFLRIAEDRSIEGYGDLKNSLSGKNFYEALFKLFQKADEKYNSGLFKPSAALEKIRVSNELLNKIIVGLYYPKSPYEFSVLPIEILGKAYEQFLGKQIKLSTSGSIKIEEKPEVRWAGGVYYTPKHIVDHIVSATLGKVCAGKTPEQIEEIKILDPASGSGSFLIGAYEYLLNWHKDYYNKNKAKIRKKKLNEILTPSGDLTTKEKGKILLNNIFGVDIDLNAVEVTKLSLLLKCMEGENKDTIRAQMQLFHERLLPTLENNIKCGNSLIDFDIYSKFPDLSDDIKVKRKINAHNWRTAFKEVIESGGFDVVLGNPPYGFHQIHLDVTKDYFRSKFDAAVASFENYFLFYEQSLELLKSNGRHGFIVPVTWLTIPSAKALREFVLNKYSISEIIWFNDLVFKEAQVNTLISITENKLADGNNMKIFIYEGSDFSEPPIEKYILDQNKFHSDNRSIDIFIKANDEDILEKIKKISTSMGQITKPCSGYNPYEVGKGVKPSGGTHTLQTVQERPYHSVVKKNGKWKPEISGKDLRRFSYKFSNNQWVKYGSWLAAARDPENYLGPRILVQEITGGEQRRIVAAYCDEELYYSRDVIPVKQINEDINLKFLLGLINSNLMTWYHHKKNPKAKKKLFPKVLVGDLKTMPIRLPNFGNKSDARLYNEIIDITNQLILLNSGPSARNDCAISSEANFLEDRLNELIYKLYGLTDAEIATVEGAL